MPIPDNWKLPDVIRNRLGAEAGRQRAMVHEGHLLLILHKVPAIDEESRIGAYFWRDPDGKWSSAEGGKGVNGLKAHIEAYGKAIDELEARFDPTCDVKSQFELLQHVVRVHRSATNGCAALQAAREGVPQDRELISLRDGAIENERNIELLHTDIQNALDYEVARRAAAQARAGNRLNLLAALFLPVTALAGIFGMDLTHGLDTDNPVLFWSIVALGLTLGVLVGYKLSDRHNR